jgi:hypothetical protein
LPAAGALAGALVLAWLLANPRTPDLAAQYYRVRLFGESGFAIWDEHWYAGHALPGYSLLFPPLGSLLGVRLLGALSALGSAALFAGLLARVYGPAARWGAMWFAVAAVGDIWNGRLSFALGVTLACGAGLALLGRRTLLAAALAALCAAASPVAGLLLGMAGLTVSLQRRSPRAVLALGLPAALVVLALAVLFPEGGWEPFPLRSFAVAALVGVAFLAALPRGERLLQTGAVVYLLACVLFVAIHSPVGSNVARYAVLLAGPLLLCARGRARSRARAHAEGGGASAGALAVTGAGGPARRGSRPPVRAEAAVRGLLPAAALSLMAVWVIWGPVRETLAVAGSPATSAAYYLPVERFVAGLREGPVRLEVPLTRSHWEADLLAPSVSLARGWEKQLETRYDDVLLRPGLTAGAYRAWLAREAVGYVALPDVPLDPSSSQEGRLIASGLPYLKLVAVSAHWRIYRVLGARPLLSGPGRLARLGHDSFTIDARSAGSFLVRVRYTRYWALGGARGCVGEAPGGWTEVELDRAGAATVEARFSLERALGSGSGCRARAAAALRTAR